MITDPQLMPDFRDGLEEALYRRASAAPSPARRVPRALPRPTLAGRLALGAAVLVAAIAVVLTSLPGHKASRTAFAEPLILTSSPTQPVPPGLSAGVLAKDVLGPDAEFERVIPLSVFGVQAYLAQAQTGWCLIPRLIGGTDLRGLGSSSCATTSQLERVGLAVITQGTYVAVVPPTAQAPTLTEPGSAGRPLSANSLGVVAITGLGKGDAITRHGLDGASITDVVN